MPIHASYFPRQLILLVFATCTGLNLSAQEIDFERIHPGAIVEGRTLPLAWFGGLNSPQIQAVDLDDDGTDDLLLFDRVGEHLMALRRTDAGVVAAPELLAHFPEINEWMVVRDYNQDGIPDLFAHALGVEGIHLYRGSRDASGLLRFELMLGTGPEPILYFPNDGGRSAIFVTSVDYPSIEDVDFDGDLDILTFSVLGGYLQYYQNQTVERGLSPDSVDFRLVDLCYGGFFESGLTNELDLADAPGNCFQSVSPDRPAQPRHAGSTVLSLDYDGNGLMDLLLGDISYSRLVLGLNNGSNEQAWISEQDTSWKSGDATAEIPFFPAAFHLDADGDGDRDIIASPTTVLFGSDVDVTWLYENVGTDAAPEFTFRTPRFLVEDMIDIGTRANVASFDYDADGRPDIVAGNFEEYSDRNLRDSRFRLFRNVTPPGGELAFELVDEDYMGMSAYQAGQWNFSPSYGDLDGDGDQDAVVGTRDGTVIYFENLAGAGTTANFGRPIFEWQGVDVGQFSIPELADMDRDGLLDLLVGNFNGAIQFYRNIGTATEPAFDPNTSAVGNSDQLGGIDTRVGGSSVGDACPVLLRQPNYSLIITGNRSGTLEAYRFDVDAAPDQDFTLLSDTLGGLTFGSFTHPAFDDFDGDGILEAVVGTERGGLEFFRTNLDKDNTVSTRSPLARDLQLDVYPNPTSGDVTFSGWKPGELTDLTLFDISGRRLSSWRIPRSSTSFMASTQVRGSEMKSGVLIARLSGPKGTVSRRILLQAE